MIKALNKNRKKIMLLFILITSAILLSGCVEQSVVISVNSSGKTDGSVLTIKLVADKEDYQKVEVLGIEPPKNDDLYPKELRDVNPFFRKVASKYNLQDMEITPINDSFEIGFVAHKNFNSIESLNSFIKHLNSEDLIPFDGEVKMRDLKVAQFYSAEGQVEYKIDEEVRKIIEEASEDKSFNNPELQELINDSVNTKAVVEFIFPGGVQKAEGFDEESSEDNPIFTNNLGSEAKTISIFSRNIDKSKFAVALTFAIVIVIVIIRAIVLKIIRKIRRG